jgi:atlastin
MEGLVGGNTPYVNPKQLERKHEELTVSSVELFEKTRKMGGREYSESYLNELKSSIQESWTHFEAQNKSKNVFSLLGAPAVLLVWTVVCFIISRIFEIVGLVSISNLFMTFGTMSLCLTIAYMFFR